MKFIAKFYIAGLLALTGWNAGAQSLLTTQRPALLNLSDGANVNYELGMRFYVTAPGSIKSIRFYKSSRERGSHTGKIYSARGQLLASVVFTSETASGWQSQNLAQPLPILANTEYVVSVNTGRTYYVATNNGMATQISNGPVRSVVGNNGVYGPVGRRPSSSWQSSNYFRDIVFVPDSVSPPPPPPPPPHPPPVDSAAPSVGITSPSANALISGSQVTVAATAADNVAVAGVQFKIDGNNIGAEDLTAPYAVSLNTLNLSNGTHVITAVARDAAGNSATSAAVAVNVNNSVALPDYCKTGGPMLWANLEACGWPGKNNTGPSGNLAVKTGGLSINAAGVYENLDIRGGLTINASNVTVRNFRVTETGGYASVVVANGVTNVKFEDCEINANFKNQFGIWVYSSNSQVTVRRCEIYNLGNAIQAGQGLIFEDNYCHDIDQMPNDGDDQWHVNCVINLNDSRGISNMVIRHNTMRLGSPGGTHPFSGVLNLIVQNNVVIENNLMASGSYTIYLFDSRYGGSVPSNSRVTNNKFSTVDYVKIGLYGIWYPGQGYFDYAPYVQFSGNTVLETGQSANGL